MARRPVGGNQPLGFHDGIDSWTVSVATELGGSNQSFVSRHEAAHHRLHSGTPWGLAVTASGIPNGEGFVAAARWRELLEDCRHTHEVYATWAAVVNEPEAREILGSNLAYASYMRDATYLAEAISDDPVIADRGLDVLLRLVMAPQLLRGIDLRGIRSSELTLGPEAHPDNRLESLLDDFPESLANSLRAALDVSREQPVEFDRTLGLLDELGVPSMSFGEQARWMESLVSEIEVETPGRFQVAVVGLKGRLDELLDDQQRERIRMHDGPLPLRVVKPDDRGRFDPREFARTAEGVGKHVWLAWLHPGYLRKQFDDFEELSADMELGLLSCDRTHGPPHANWLSFEDVPPGIAARLVERGNVTPLLFTTLRTLDATGEETDFRGFEPAFVLIDSDILAFLQTSLSGGDLSWSVIGSSGSRTIDILVFERPRTPGIFYLHVCSAPTGRLIAGWLRSQSPACDPDHERFAEVRSLVWALTEHLLGTFWIFDLYGFSDPASEPAQ